MDGILELRYRYVFETYSPSRNAGTDEIKERIRGQIKNNYLRPDAGLFLLINLDQMLYKAYFEPLREPFDGRILANPSGFDPNILSDREHPLIKAFEVIMRNLQGEPPFSSHDAIKSIEISWEELSLLFGWA